MKQIRVHEMDELLGTITLTPEGLKCTGPEAGALDIMLWDYQQPGDTPEQTLDRIFERLRGFVWAEKVE